MPHETRVHDLEGFFCAVGHVSAKQVSRFDQDTFRSGDHAVGRSGGLSVLKLPSVLLQDGDSALHECREIHAFSFLEQLKLDRIGYVAARLPEDVGKGCTLASIRQVKTVII